jgi:hypothetical protein
MLSKKRALNENYDSDESAEDYEHKPRQSKTWNASGRDQNDSTEDDKVALKQLKKAKVPAQETVGERAHQNHHRSPVLKKLKNNDGSSRTEDVDKTVETLAEAEARRAEKKAARQAAKRAVLRQMKVRDMPRPQILNRICT